MALTVFHEREEKALWDYFEPIARQAGGREAVIDAIAAGTAPRGLLPRILANRDGWQFLASIEEQRCA